MRLKDFIPKRLKTLAAVAMTAASCADAPTYDLESLDTNAFCRAPTIEQKVDGLIEYFRENVCTVPGVQINGIFFDDTPTTCLGYGCREPQTGKVSTYSESRGHNGVCNPASLGIGTAEQVTAMVKTFEVASIEATQAECHAKGQRLFITAGVTQWGSPYTPGSCHIVCP